MGQIRPCLFLLMIAGAFGAALQSDRDRVVDLQELLLDVSDGFKKFGEDIKQTLGMVTKSLHEFSENMQSLKTALNEVKKSSVDITNVGQEIKQNVEKTSTLVNRLGQSLDENIQKSTASFNTFSKLITDKVRESSNSLNTFGQTIENHHRKTDTSLTGFQNFLNEFSRKTSNTCNAISQYQEKILSDLKEVKEVSATVSSSNKELKTELEKSTTSIQSMVQDQREIKNTVNSVKEVTTIISTSSKEMKENFGSCCSSIKDIAKDQKDLKETITGKINEVIVKVNGSLCENKDKDDKDKDDKDKDDKDKDDKDKDKEVIDTGEPVEDCADIYRKYGYRTNGIYNIKPLGVKKAFPVYCDMTEGGGWTVIQKRGKSTYNEQYFTRSWLDYKNGFGELDREFWLGNDRISALTNQGEYQIKIDLWDHDTNHAFAQYNNFRIASASDNFKLDIRGYSGTAGDALKAHNNQYFSTRDQNNNPGQACTEDLNNGGWWYGPCDSNLNGWNLRREHDDLGRGIKWTKWLGRSYSLSASTMKIRPKEYFH